MAQSRVLVNPEKMIINIDFRTTYSGFWYKVTTRGPPLIIGEIEREPSLTHSLIDHLAAYFFGSDAAKRWARIIWTEGCF